MEKNAEQVLYTLAAAALMKTAYPHWRMAHTALSSTPSPAQPKDWPSTADRVKQLTAPLPTTQGPTPSPKMTEPPASATKQASAGALLRRAGEALHKITPSGRAVAGIRKAVGAESATAAKAGLIPFYAARKGYQASRNLGRGRLRSAIQGLRTEGRTMVEGVKATPGRLFYKAFGTPLQREAFEARVTSKGIRRSLENLASRESAKYKGLKGQRRAFKEDPTRGLPAAGAAAGGAAGLASLRRKKED